MPKQGAGVLALAHSLAQRRPAGPGLAKPGRRPTYGRPRHASGTLTAAPITSGGRCSPLEPFGIDSP